MRIGLLGGSFNPAHEGHLQISLTAIKRLQLHKLWWLVTPGNPLKSADELASLDVRLECARKVAAHPRIEVTAFEAGLPSRYACDTIAFLQQRYPDVLFTWIIGGDILVQFHKWRCWAQIFLSVPVFVADRPEYRHIALASPAAKQFAGAYRCERGANTLISTPPPAWTYASMPLSRLSSTAIRQGETSKNHRKMR